MIDLYGWSDELQAAFAPYAARGLFPARVIAHHRDLWRLDPVERLVDMIQSEAARIRGNDLSALNAVLGSQALALDTIFAELVKKCGRERHVLYDALRLALKAQSQSRAALDSIVTVARPRALATRSNGNFDEQTAASGNSSSR